MSSSYDLDWLALLIGNSRLHWAWFKGDVLVQAWHSDYISEIEGELIRKTCPPALQEQFSCQFPLYIASVVPAQTAIWCNYPHSQLISLQDIPLQGIYSTMGVDRALAVWGATEIWGYPCLALDGGTALTFTGVDGDRALVGGAILPGLRLQLQSLAQKTAALPEVNLTENLPIRWANNTEQAIASGIIYTAIAGIKDFIRAWREQYGDSKLIFTGGDGKLLLAYLQLIHPEIAAKIAFDPNLVFWGMRSLIPYLTVMVIGADIIGRS
ncbi:MAG: pantothenate kinase [Prochloraceae cyanobacterium]